MNTVVTPRLRISTFFFVGLLAAFAISLVVLSGQRGGLQTIASVSVQDTATSQSAWNGTYARPELSPGSTFASPSGNACVAAAESVSIAPTVINDVFSSYGITQPDRANYTIVRVIPKVLGGDDTAANLYPRLTSSLDTSSDAAQEARYTSAACR